MHMRKAPFLKLYAMYMRMYISENVLVHNVVKERVFVQIKHLDDQIGTIGCRLSRHEFVFEGSPRRIGCEGDKEVESVILARYRNCVLETLVHIPGPADIRRREDNATTD